MPLPEEPSASVRPPRPVVGVEPPAAGLAEASWLERVRSGLRKTRASLGGSLATLFASGRQIDADLLEEMETLLLTADVGITATNDILAAVTGTGLLSLMFEIALVVLLVHPQSRDYVKLWFLK